MKLHVILALALAASAHAGGTLFPPDPGKKVPAVLPLEPAAASPVKVPPVIPLTPPADPKLPDAPPKVPPVIPLDPLASQLPAQLPPPPAQMPAQMPPPTTAAPTSPTNTPAEATAAAPAAMPLSIAPQALPAPTSSFQGFAMTDRSYEVLTLAVPTPVRAGASASRGRLTVGSAGFTLSNVRIAGPWSLRGQATLWQVAADAYPDGYPYRAGAVYLHVMQAAGQPAIVDGQGWLYRTRHRMIASGNLATGGPLELPAATSPSAPHTEDLKNRP